jgi:hypothetical protein
MGRFGYIYSKTGDTSSPFSFTSFVTAAAGATITPTSLVADVFSAEEAVITMIATPASSSTSTITFNWIGRAHPGASWPTVTDFSTTLVLADDSENQCQNKLIDCIPYYEIKLKSIVNGDGENALTDINCWIGYKH